MVFSSGIFLFAYLPIVVLIYYAIPKRFQLFFLFPACLFFYGWGEPKFALLMLFSIMFNYGSAALIDAPRRSSSARKILLVACVTVNLALLCVFKYAVLLFDTAATVIPALGAVSFPDIPLPIGISFFTFQAMSYVIDVYRGDVRANKSAIEVGAYVSLFPQLIAGPIVRYEDVEKDMANRNVRLDDLESGMRVFIVGLSKKLLLANPLGEMWSFLSQSPATNGALGSWLGITAFAFQIYFDFSGYSDMAIGMGRMLGFHFLDNFNYPYIAKSVTDFWRRWHISLSTWFRMYVYIPLGGNRKGALRQAVNLFIVWFLTGLWHGASWNFALWGVYYAIILILEKLFLLRALDKAPSAVGRVYTIAATLFGWTLFCFTDFSELSTYLSSMFVPAASGVISNEAARIATAYLPTMIACAVACTPVPKTLWNKFVKPHAVGAVAAVFLLALCASAVVTQSYNPFIYFRF